MIENSDQNAADEGNEGEDEQYERLNTNNLVDRKKNARKKLYSEFSFMDSVVSYIRRFINSGFAKVHFFNTRIR